jgi:hypothetical protein
MNTTNDYLKALEEQDRKSSYNLIYYKDDDGNFKFATDQPQNNRIQINLWKTRWNIFKENLKHSIIPTIKSYNPFDLTMGEWKELPSISTPWDRLKYVFCSIYYITKSSFCYIPMGFSRKKYKKSTKNRKKTG